MGKKIKVRICVGTYCFVMGNHDLKDLKDKLPEDLKDKVYVEGVVCLGCDKLKENPQPPYVEINGKLINNACFEKIVEEIRKVDTH